jgi:4-hydroxy 2-oxovalerate aldolase
LVLPEKCWTGLKQKIVKKSKKVNFNISHIKNLYSEFQSTQKKQYPTNSNLEEIFRNKVVLLIAPGKSITEEIFKINNFIHHNKPIVISVNFFSNEFSVDYVFFSNRKRFKSYDSNEIKNLIITNNIDFDSNTILRVNYDSLLNNIRGVEDNSGLMLIKLLLENQVSKIFLAGFDGYDTSTHNVNFTFDSNITPIHSIERKKIINLGMNFILNEYSKKANIIFLTSQKFINIFGIENH